MRNSFLIFLLLLVVGCQNIQRPEAPVNLIPEDKMVHILVDAYIGNAARGISNRVIREKGIELDSVLYRKYNIDSLQFVKSNSFYAANLNGYASLLKKVEAQLVHRKAVYDSLYKLETEMARRKRDSIKKADSIQGKPIPTVEEGSLIQSVEEIEE